MNYKISGVDVAFPFAAYPTQLMMMGKIIAALKQRENALIECPTGTGKSMALLCSAMAFVEQWSPALDAQTATKPKMLSNPATNATGEATTSTHPVVPGNGFFADSSGGIASQIQAMAPSARVPTPKKRAKKPVLILVHELKATPHRPSMTILGSREQMCTNDSVQPSSDRDEICKKMVEDHSCGHFHRSKDLRAHPTLESNKVWDIEDIVQAGRECGGCPYYASRDLLPAADLVMCPYNYIIDPNIRKASNINLKNAILIVDEAHNIDSVCREAASLDIKLSELTNALPSSMSQASLGVGPTTLIELITNVQRWILESESSLAINRRSNSRSHTWNGSEILHALQVMGLAIGQVQRLRMFLQQEEQKLSTTNHPGPFMSKATLHVAGRLITVAELISGSGRVSGTRENDYRLVLHSTTNELATQTRGAIGQELTLSFWCMSGGVVFSPIARECRSVVLLSGTLSPMEHLAAELSAQFPITLEAPHVVNVQKQLWVGTLGKGKEGRPLRATFRETEKLEFQDGVGDALLSVCKNVPDGVLCFFSSYSVLEKLLIRWKATKLFTEIAKIKHIICESKGNDSFDRRLQIFNREADPSTRKFTSKTGALCLAVCRGKASEGIDFADHRARAVVVVGIPLPSFLCPKVVLKKDFNDLQHKSNPTIWPNGDKWYQTCGFRAINQAIGRCIRHKKDYGAILLIDERFTAPSGVNSISKWLRKHITHYDTPATAADSLGQFFKDVLNSPIFTDPPPSDHAQPTQPALPVQADSATGPKQEKTTEDRTPTKRPNTITSFLEAFRFRGSIMTPEKVPTQAESSPSELVIETHIPATVQDASPHPIPANTSPSHIAATTSHYQIPSTTSPCPIPATTSPHPTTPFHQVTAATYSQPITESPHNISAAMTVKDASPQFPCSGVVSTPKRSPPNAGSIYSAPPPPHTPPSNRSPSLGSSHITQTTRIRTPTKSSPQNSTTSLRSHVVPHSYTTPISPSHPSVPPTRQFEENLSRHAPTPISPSPGPPMRRVKRELAVEYTCPPSPPAKRQLTHTLTHTLGSDMLRWRCQCGTPLAQLAPTTSPTTSPLSSHASSIARLPKVVLAVHPLASLTFPRLSFGEGVWSGEDGVVTRNVLCAECRVIVGVHVIATVPAHDAVRGLVFLDRIRSAIE